MLNVNVNRKIILSFLIMVSLICGLPGVSSALEAPDIKLGDDETTLTWSFSDTFGPLKWKAYEIEYRRKTPQGAWERGCTTIFNSEPREYTGIVALWISGLDPGTTYQVRYRDTNQSVCTNNPPNPGPWSPIGEGTTGSGQSGPEVLVVDPDSPPIYWTDYGTNTIQRVNLDGSNVQDLVTQGLITPSGIALDVAGGKMYWMDWGTKKIQRANLDNSNVEDLVTQRLEGPNGIALDIVGGKMYWTDEGTKKIQRANLDGSNVENLVTSGLISPGNIALDVAKGKMYWTDYDTDKIQCANLDGSNVQDLITQGLRAPWGIALDVVGGKMYWTDWVTEKIQCANLDGSNVQDLVTQKLDSPWGIALDVAGGKMYWSHMDWNSNQAGWENGKIQRANLDGSNVEDLVTGLHNPEGIALGIRSQTTPTPSNSAPVFTDGTTATRTIAENTSAGENIGTPMTATDADNDTLTYTLSGTDAAAFDIDSTSGQLITKAALDYETKTSYSVIITVSDGSLTDTITVTINVTDVVENSAPVFTDGTTATRTIAENTSAGENIGTPMTATDADNDTLTYTLSGTDAAAYDIVISSGQLITKAALDYETKTSYSVIITVSDGSLTDTITVTINITNVATVSIVPSTKVSPAIEEMLTLSLNIKDSEAVAGYQATVQFDDTALRYVSSANGDYLPAGSFFVDPVVEGNLVKLNAVSLAGESTGDGTLATLTFEVIAIKNSTLTLSDVLLTNSAGEAIVPDVENAEITEPTGLKEDVNGDGIVDVKDLVYVSELYGQTGTTAADVNGDGVVNIDDLILIAAVLDANAAAAPFLHNSSLEGLSISDVRQWLSETQDRKLNDPISLKGLLFLEQLLNVLTPKETLLLPNFPNPFNPETWIPYHLSKDADVSVHIYAVNGTFVRMLTLGHQAAGLYQTRSRAAYWDGKNEFGEKVASGLYFYTLTAGDFSATRKMLIRK